MRIGVIAQRGNDRAVSLAARIHRGVEGNCDVVLGDTAAPAVGIEPTPIDAMAGLPLVVSIGGDGTFLYVARHVGSTPIIGVNLGEVGFLVGVPPGEVVDAVRAEIRHIRQAGTPRTRSLPRLTATGDGIDIPPALNEILVHGPRRGRNGGVELDVDVDGTRYARVCADGVIVATATGSTAYNLSETGPIAHPDVAGIIVNPMAPRDPVPPMVVDADASIGIEARDADRVLVASDGSARTWKVPPVSVGIAAADEPARVAGPRPDFFRSLRKLENAEHLGPGRGADGSARAEGSVDRERQT